MRLSSFGCQTSEHLLQRLATVIPNWVVIAGEFSSLETCTLAIEACLDVQVFDCHVRQKFTRPDAFEWDLLPTTRVEVWFRSTVQPKCRCMIRVSPETYFVDINDMESSGLWEYEGESPIGEPS